MDVLTFVSKVVEAGAWPGVVVFVVWKYGKQMALLIPLLQKLKAGPVELDFGREARATLAASVEVEQQVAAGVPLTAENDSTNASEPPGSAGGEAAPTVPMPADEAVKAAEAREPSSPDASTPGDKTWEKIFKYRLRTKDEDWIRSRFKNVHAEFWTYDPASIILGEWARTEAEIVMLAERSGLACDPADRDFRWWARVLSYLSTDVRSLVFNLKRLRDEVAGAKVTPTEDAARDYLVASQKVRNLIVAVGKPVEAPEQPKG